MSVHTERLAAAIGQLEGMLQTPIRVRAEQHIEGSGMGPEDAIDLLAQTVVDLTRLVVRQGEDLAALSAMLVDQIKHQGGQIQ